MTCRIDVFATIQRRVRRKLVAQRVGWQAWHPAQDAGRLPGAGSFYWPSPRAAFRHAVILMRQDPSVEAVRIEGISGQPVAFLRRPEMPLVRHGCHPGQAELIARF